MRVMILRCEVCGKPTPHQIDGDPEDGELALCTNCGRVVSLPAAPPKPESPQPPRCRR